MLSSKNHCWVRRQTRFDCSSSNRGWWAWCGAETVSFNELLSLKIKASFASPSVACHRNQYVESEGSGGCWCWNWAVRPAWIRIHATVSRNSSESFAYPVYSYQFCIFYVSIHTWECVGCWEWREVSRRRDSRRRIPIYFSSPFFSSTLEFLLSAVIYSFFALDSKFTWTVVTPSLSLRGNYNFKCAIAMCVATTHEIINL